MDKRHREELDQNDLESALVGLRDHWEKYGLHVLVVLLAAAVAFTGVRWYRSSRATAREQELAQLESSTSPDSFRAVAQSAGTPEMAALAYLRGADLALAKAELPPPPPAPSASTQPVAPEPPVTPEARKRLLDDADAMYRAVIEKPGVAGLLVLNAKMGLAAVDEARGQWPEAGKLYKEVVDESDTYAVIKAKAEGHLAILDRLSAPVPYSPEPKPATLPSLSTFSPDLLTPATAPAHGATGPAATKPATTRP